MFLAFCAPAAGESRRSAFVPRFSNNLALNDGKRVLLPRLLVSYHTFKKCLNSARSFDSFDLFSRSETEEREITDYNELILADVRKRRETKQQYN